MHPLFDGSIRQMLVGLESVDGGGHEFGGDLHAVSYFICHWCRVLPVPLLEVDYEETVADVEGTARRLVDWSGLAWEPGCLAFHERRQLVRTASATQVRQPIYRNAVGRWKHYEQALAPLFAML